MEKENLTCINCNQQWQRTRTRGRKPQLCPSCIGVQDTSSKDDDTSYDSTYYPPNTKWICPYCKINFKTFIALDIKPAHKCAKRANRFMSFDSY